MKKWSSLYGKGAEGKGQTREGAEAGEGAEVGVRLERLLDVGVRLKRLLEEPETWTLVYFSKVFKKYAVG